MKNFVIIIFILSGSLFAQSTSLMKLKSEFNYSNSTELVKNLSSSLEIKSQKKNPALAILFSMLLPGMGELYGGNYQSGQYFTIAEAAFLGVYVGMNFYGDWKKDNYETFAGSAAGVDLKGKNEDYFGRIGEYKDIEQYNNIKALNREFNKMYDPAVFYWQWKNDEDRKNYRDMWLSSRHAYNNLRFVVGAMLLNRLTSAINAVRVVTAYNKSLESSDQTGLYFNANPDPNAVSSITVNFFTAF